MFAAACRPWPTRPPRRGLLLVLEDLQWADRTSLLLLRHLAGELAGRRLLVAGHGSRKATARHWPSCCPNCCAPASARPIRLTGLSQPDIAQWLRQLGPGRRPGRAGRAAAGQYRRQPAARADADERGPSALDDGLRDSPNCGAWCLTQVGGLPNVGPGPARRASVLGEQIDPPLLAEVSGLSAAETGAILDEATALGVLAAAPDVAGLSFAHALVRDAIYDELAPSRRMALHQRAARALEQSVASRGLRRADRHPLAAVRSAGLGRTRACAGPGKRPGRPRPSLAYDEAARFTALALRAAEARFRAHGRPLTDRAHPGRCPMPTSLAGHIEASLPAARPRPGWLSGPPGPAGRGGPGDHRDGRSAHHTAVEALCAAALVALPAEDTALRARLRARQAIAAAETGSGTGPGTCRPRLWPWPKPAATPTRCSTASHARHLSLCAPQFLAERRGLAVRRRSGRQPGPSAAGRTVGHVWLADAAFQAGDLAEVDRRTRPHRAVRGGQQARLGLVAPIPAAGQPGRASRRPGRGDRAQRGGPRGRDRIGADSTIGMYYAFLNQLAISARHRRSRGRSDHPDPAAAGAEHSPGPGLRAARARAAGRP